MRRTRYLILFLAIYFVFVGGSSRYVTLYQVRVLHHIIVTGVLSLWLIHRIRTKKGIPTTPFNAPLFVLIGVWFLSSLLSLDPRMGFEHMWFPFTFVVIFFIIVDFFQRGRGKIIMEAFFFVIVIVIFLTGLELASWYFGLGLLPGTDVGWWEAGIIIPPQFPRVSMAMGISTLVAGFTVPSIFVTGTWALTVRHKSHKRILSIITVLLCATLILTFSRGGLLALLSGLATFAVIRAVQHPALSSRVSPTVIGGIGGTIALGLLALFAAFTLPYAIGKSDEGRLDMWQSAVEITVDHPITGVGPGLFGRAYRNYRDPLVGRDKLTAAHNLYLNVASELGIIGIAVGSWLLFVLLQTSRKTWQQAKGRNQHLRVEGLFVALVALAVHSLVDVFTITPINTVFIIIVAYLATGQRSILAPRPNGQIRSTYALLAITVIFGLALLQWDRAQGLFQSSFGKAPREALVLTAQAQDIDPHLNLYRLHEAFLLGQIAHDLATTNTAIHAYEKALQLEPTWDTGWINLSALELQRDNPATALNYLHIAHEIYPSNSAIFAFARVADEYNLRDSEIIVNAYQQALRFAPYLPLSNIWWNTPRSTRATQAFLNNRNPELQYRVYRNHDPQQAQALLSDQPQTAPEWWVVGEHALKQENLPTAEDAFNKAIQLHPTHGDYYVSRAKSRLSQPVLAKRDLQLAKLYGTQYEYPDTVQALLPENAVDAANIKARALPIRTIGQEFAAVLYARPAVFDVTQQMRYPGLGESILQPWYEIAESFLHEGKLEQAIRAYQFILENAPYESRAKNQLLTWRQNQ